MSKELNTLEKLLKNHDWFYQYSEDYNVYEQGQTAWNAIAVVMSALKDAGFEHEAEYLYEKYLPQVLKY